MQPSPDETCFNIEHPLREELHNELHARPSIYFDGDTDVWHIAILGRDGAPRVPRELLTLEGLSTTQQGKHGTACYSDGRVKWELHSDFLTLTFVGALLDCPAAPPKAFRKLCALVDGEVIAAVHVIVRDETDEKQIEVPWLDGVASEVGGGDAEVYSNFRLNKAGFVDFMLLNRNLNAYRTGRMVRRLLEIETYRMMALLAMPVARQTVVMLTTFDGRLSRLIAHMQSTTRVDKALLSEVTSLSSDVLKFSATARQRFGASKACAEIVASRIEELREGRVEQRQRVGTFIDRRFQPAIRFFCAAETRLNELAERVRLAGDLLRTTVQVQLEDQNASLLSSMEERARVQAQIQQAVEGFSVIAITYYVIGLAKIALEDAVDLGLNVHVGRSVVLGSIPLVLLSVWMTVQYVRKSHLTRLRSSNPTKRSFLRVPLKRSLQTMLRRTFECLQSAFARKRD